jgi:hypothetical protein
MLNGPDPEEEVLKPLNLLRRLDRIEHDLGYIKKIIWIVIAGTLAVFIQGIASHMSWRINADPPPSNKAERMGADRVPEPGHSE